MTGGGRYEREIVNTFHGAGWGAMRAPASGSATGYDVADVIFGRPVEVHGMGVGDGTYSDIGFIETKKRSVPRAYYDVSEVYALQRVAEEWGGTAYLGARFTRSVDGNAKRTYLVEVADAEQVSEERYRVHADDAFTRASLVVDASAGEVNTI